MPNVEPQKEREELLVRQAEELVFETLYSPVDLSALLATADGRGRIRRVSPAHLYYGLQKLEDSEITTLLPHVTQEQWTGVLDLDLWSKDEMSTGAFLYLEGFIAGADDPVARKLIRAADPELWSLLFKRRLRIHQRIEEDEFEGAPEEGERLETPDGAFLLILPEDPEESRRLRALVSRLFGLDPELATILLLEAQARTSVELEEEGYQNRKRRIETAGFQDYFDSFEIFSVLSPDDPLPEKKRESIVELSTLPILRASPASEQLLLFQAISSIADPSDHQLVLEEFFFVCNKVLSADQASPADQEQVRTSIQKTLTGINLGLDWWSEGNLQKASDGLTRYYLQSFFQHGHSRLMELRQRAQSVSTPPALGSFEEDFLEALTRPYPLLAEMREGKIGRRLFRSRDDLEEARTVLERVLST